MRLLPDASERTQSIEDRRGAAAVPIASLIFLLTAWCSAGVALAEPPATLSPAPVIRLLVQSSQLAGFRYASAGELWPHLQVGDRLELKREADNPHDTRAVRVEWRGHKLGYVPKRENDAVAWAMDRGDVLRARISRLEMHRNPARRIEFEIFID